MMRFIFAFIISFPVWSNVRLELGLQASEIATGEIIPVTLYLKTSTSESLNQGLKGVNFNDTLYIHSVSPFLVASSGEALRADAKVIFLKQPETEKLETKVGEQVVEIYLPALILKQTDAKEFEYGEFSIPEEVKFLVWVLIFIIVMMIGYYVRKYLAIRRRKNQKILYRKELGQKIVDSKNYDEIVECWKNKRTYLKEFAGSEELFNKFELVLFKVQFKPMPTESEKQDVKDAYATFCTEFLRREDGI